MRSLGDVLDVMVTCGERWPSVHAELVFRYDPAAASDAVRALLGVDDVPADPAGATGPAGQSGAATLAPAAAVPAPAAPTQGDDPPGPLVRRGRLLAADGLTRVEWPDEDEVTVVAGEHWRRRLGQEVSGIGSVAGASLRAGHPRRPAVVVRQQALVRPWLLLAWLHLRVVGPVRVGGRPSTRLAGEPRSRFRPPQLDGLADGAQRVDLVVDDGTGVVVELAAYYQGRLVEGLALRHLTVGDTPDPRLFDLAALGRHDGGGGPC
jgi:hypothetical protein